MNEGDHSRKVTKRRIDKQSPHCIVKNEQPNYPKLGEQVALYSEADGSTNELKIGGISVNLER